MMKTSSISRFTGIAAAAVLMMPMAVSAQGFGGPGGYGQMPPPPMFGGGGPEQGFGQGQGLGQGMRPPRPAEISPASIPVSTLAQALKLTDDQRTKIAAIQAKFESVRKALAPEPTQMSNRQRPGAGQGGRPGLGGPQGQGFGGPSGPNGFGGPPQDGGFNGPPPPQQMGFGGPPQFGGQGQFNRQGPGGIVAGDEVDDINADASDKIVAVLSPDQQVSLTKLLRNLRDLRLVGISPESYSNLDLTGSQMSKIASLASQHRDDVLKAIDTNQDPAAIQASLQHLRRKLHDDAVAVLTDDQAAIVRAQHLDGPGGQGQPGGAFGYGQRGQRAGGPGGQNDGAGFDWNGAGGPPQGAPGGFGDPAGVGGQQGAPQAIGVPGVDNNQPVGGPAPGM